MCGRFHLGFSHKQTQKIIRDIPDEQRIQLHFGDIFPDTVAPVISAEETFAARWGFGRFAEKGLLINARAETVTEKQTFRKSFLERRCLIPASGFYEWDRNKNKFYFSRKDGNLIYLCGFYRIEDSIPRFVILTKPATPPVVQHHDRIPVIAEDAVKYRYLTDMYFASDYILNDPLIKLNCR